MSVETAPRTSSRTRTVLIVVSVLCGALALGCIACGIGGYFWAQRTASEMRETGERVEAEAAAWAAARTQDECVEESLRRSDVCGDDAAIMCRVEAGVFLQRCIERAAPTPGFCDGAPPLGDIMAGAEWAVAYCAARGRSNDPRCTQLVRPVADYCAGAR